MYFLNIMLNLLRENTRVKVIKITKEFKQDLNWFQRFHLDACPSGLGAIFDNQVYAMPLLNSWHDQNILLT